MQCVEFLDSNQMEGQSTIVSVPLLILHSANVGQSALIARFMTAINKAGISTTKYTERDSLFFSPSSLRLIYLPSCTDLLRFLPSRVPRLGRVDEGGLARGREGRQV